MRHGADTSAAGAAKAADRRPGKLAAAPVLQVPRPSTTITSPWRPRGKVQAPTHTSVAEPGSGWSAARFGVSFLAALVVLIELDPGMIPKGIGEDARGADDVGIV